MQNGDILVPANPGSPEKLAIKIERKTRYIRANSIFTVITLYLQNTYEEFTTNLMKILKTIFVNQARVTADE